MILTTGSLLIMVLAGVATQGGSLKVSWVWLAGFYMVDVGSLEEAISFAKQIPNSESGTIEVRAVADHSDI